MSNTPNNTGFVSSPLSSSHMKNLHKNPYTYIAVLGALCLVLVFSALRGEKAVPKAAAEWAPEALQLVDQIKTASTKWKTGNDDLTAAQKAVSDAQQKIREAEAAAKGADLTLCASFHARYDRATQTIVSDANCPLL